MRVGSFSLLIPEGVERDSAHVELRHNTVYRVRLGNHGNRRCDAELSIDGKFMGCYRLDAGTTVTLERSVADNGCFTFMQADTSEAAAGGVDKVQKVDRGLVQVVFKPERQYATKSVKTAPSEILLRSPGPGMFNDEYSRGASKSIPTSGEVKTSGSPLRGHDQTLGFSNSPPSGAAAGITALTGQSNQGFVTASGIEHDPAGETTISLRLVSMQGVREMKPVVPQANPVPAAVE